MNEFVETGLGNQEIFSKNLIRHLDYSGKTQKEVASAIGVSTGTFCDWVKGRSYPRMDKVQKLADYFGVKKSDLVEDAKNIVEPISDEDQEVLDLFHKVPKEKREFVLSMIRAAVDNL
jgi:transcriptional regulator with XRE-family HTH domain